MVSYVTLYELIHVFDAFGEKTMVKIRKDIKLTQFVQTSFFFFFLINVTETSKCFYSNSFRQGFLACWRIFSLLFWMTC